MHADGVEALKRMLATRFRELQEEHDLSGTELEKRTTHDRKNASGIRNQGRLPTRDVLRAYDTVFGTGSELTDLGERIRSAQKAVRLSSLTAAAGIGPSGQQPLEPQEEASATDRREFATLAALSALAATTRQRITNGGAPDQTLDDLESDVDDIARVYGSAPPTRLLQDVADRWHQTERILERRMSAETRTRATLLGGQLTYFLGRLAFNAEDFRAARRFAGLADMYAQETGEPVLLMSVATLYSSIAYHTGRYQKAVAALRSVQGIHHPYMDARVAAYNARAYAKLGDVDAARQALDQMEQTASAYSPLPGETPVGPAAVAMFRSGVGIILGDRMMVEEWAPLAIEGYSRGGGDFTIEEAQHADLTVALVHVTGPRSATEPEEAARIAQTVLGADPTHTVTAKLRQCAGAFRPSDRKLPEVAAFLDEFRALPSRPVGASLR
ncbi:hypothetical protein [Candidatus Protofrankia californiensis]|uniref:hypothetical protein n=1 Tax=Candidatus Protofrankia californiensis TaxID=1839754 RepID=UPI001F49B6D1|nr:hypothetical protein [Candidatus Protofrankia californiensis]